MLLAPLLHLTCWQVQWITNTSQSVPIKIVPDCLYTLSIMEVRFCDIKYVNQLVQIQKRTGNIQVVILFPLFFSLPYFNRFTGYIGGFDQKHSSASITRVQYCDGVGTARDCTDTVTSCCHIIVHCTMIPWSNIYLRVSVLWAFFFKEH